MDSELLKPVAGAVAGLVGTVAAIPLIFKGGLMFKREYVALETSKNQEIATLKASYESRLEERDDENDRLRDANRNLETELREQYRTNIEQTKEVLAAVRMLDKLAGLASKERRQQ